MIRNYKELEVWQIAIELAKNIYEFSKELPKEEMYGITSQIRRAVISIPSNIAEGQQRHYKKEFAQFLYQSLGSLAEIETQLILINQLYHLQCPVETLQMMDKLGRKIRQLIKSLTIPQATSPRVTEDI